MDIPKEKMIWLYKTMVRSRIMEENLLTLYREGKIPGTLHLSIGQEAAEVGVIGAMEDTDLLLSTYRSHCSALAKGVSPKEIIAEVLGRKTGVCGGIGGSMHLSEPSKGLVFTSAIVASNVPIAAGMGYAIRYLNLDKVVVAFMGDGATNNGDFHEGLNFASILSAPVLYVILNNQYAISMHIERATKIRDLYIRAQSYGIKGIVVDGMDVFEVYRKAKEAIDEIRKKKEPILMEAKTYRFVGHYAGDVDQPYRTKEEVEKWKKRDPIILAEKFLLENNILSPEEIVKIREETNEEMKEAVKYALESPYPDLDTMFMNVF